MKVAKDYSHVPTGYYKPEFEDCLVCGTRLMRSHRLWNKYLHQLCGTIYGVSMGYRCANDTCSSEMIYRSAEAESLSLKYYSFGMEDRYLILYHPFAGTEKNDARAARRSVSIQLTGTADHCSHVEDQITGTLWSVFESPFLSCWPDKILRFPAEPFLSL